MTVYFKHEGSCWTTYYAVDKEKSVVSSIEVRYRDASRSYIDTYLVSENSAVRGTYDPLATEVVLTYEKITASQWKEAKKEATDFIKYLEVFE